MGDEHRCYLQIVNWDKFQHYKDRNPPWIKFYAVLLEDPGVAALPDATKAHLFGLWLLASRLGNRIPNDPQFIAKRINATCKIDVKTLMRFSFLEPVAECMHDASNPLASCATPSRSLYLETETETEEKRDRKETDGSRRKPKAVLANLDTEPSRQLIDAYNAVFGTRIGYVPGNLSAAGRALSEGYSLEHCKTVFEAVRDAKTLTAQWCRENNREFEYLVRPTYRHNRTNEPIQGPLDKIPNELLTGRKQAI